jgi:hypothetical protein
MRREPSLRAATSSSANEDLAVAAVAVVTLRRRPGRPTARDIPVGYGWSAVGVAVFAIGGVADMVWHQALGIEAGLDALLSPPHLLLFTGGLLLVTGPIRAGLHRSHRAGQPDSWRSAAPALLATI